MCFEIIFFSQSRTSLLSEETMKFLNWEVLDNCLNFSSYNEVFPNFLRFLFFTLLEKVFTGIIPSISIIYLLFKIFEKIDNISNTFFVNFLNRIFGIKCIM